MTARRYSQFQEFFEVEVLICVNGFVFLACREADESGHVYFCSTQQAMVGSPRAGPAASKLVVLKLHPEVALGDGSCSFEQQGGCCAKISGRRGGQSTVQMI